MVSPEIKNRRHAIVVGASSMLGKRLIEHLESSGYSAYTAGRRQSHDICLDLGSESEFSIPGHIKADVLFNCAASFEGDTREGRWLNEKVNALGSYQVADLAVSAGCGALVNAGSLSSWGRSGRVGLDSYGASKARGEDILEWMSARHGIRFTSLRFPQLYDERGECCKHQLWFGRIVGYASLGRVLRLPGGNAARNFLHVLDAAAMMVAAGERKVQGVIPACNPTSETYEAIAKMAFEVFNKGGGVEIAPEKPPFRDLQVQPSIETMSALGAFPTISMRQGLSMIKDERSGHRYGPLDVD